MDELICGKCKTPIDSDGDKCPKCGARNLFPSVTDGMLAGEGHKLSRRHPGKGELQEQIDIHKSSINTELPKGVREERVIDREKKPPSYDQVVTDLSTGKVIHEEHTTLEEHNKSKDNKPRNTSN